MSEAPAVGVPEWDTADRMRKTLRDRDIAVQEMADYLEVSRNTVSTWINGRIEPSHQTLMLWAMRTGVPVKWLETGRSPHPDGPDGGLCETCAHRDSNPEPAGLEHGQVIHLGDRRRREDVEDDELEGVA